MDKLNDANDRLKPLKISLLSRGNRLSVRSTLPNIPGKPTGRSQQTIALILPCTPSGINRAEKMAVKVANDRDLGLFRWEDYQNGKQPISNPLSEAIEKHKVFYLQAGGNLATWTGEYNRFYRDLKGLDENDFIHVLNSTSPNTRTRRKAVVACNALSKFLELGFNFSGYRGAYFPFTSVQARDIPDDETIVRKGLEIPNPAWQWAYGMLATYGLRNHEVFFCKPSPYAEGAIEVTEGKTGSRTTFPLYPQWVERFDLANRFIPNIDLNREHDAIGHSVTEYFSRVTEYFSRINAPFRPYDLRHAWAIRGHLVFRLPEATLAVCLS